MNKKAIHFLGLLTLVLAVAFLVPRTAAADDDDPPGRVARLSFVQGSVSFEPAGTEDWVSAVLNRPLTTGDKLWNDNDSLSELQLGTAAIRLGSNTGISFLNLTDNTAQVSLTEGSVNIRLRNLADDETFEVDTPNLAFTLLRPGNYKINVNESGDATLVLVREGQGEVTGGGSAYTIHPREVATFTGTDQIDADVQNWDNTSDDFDTWCSERERRVDDSVSARYVPDGVIGYEDLDQYGGWRPVPEYGNVWFPRVTIAGWAPYHYGHWVYIAPWGYTWVDDAPWGFAPFHYGRWVVVGGVWGWVPAPRPVVVGAVYVRPVYAPALVAWVGGPHFAVGVGVGSVGWFPLGPREVYVPSYHVSRTYVTNINVSNTRVETTVVNNYYETTVVRKEVTRVNYVNQRVPGAVMATTSVAFTSAQPVARHEVVVNEREVRTASVGFGAPAVAPSRQAVLGAGVVVRARPPMAAENRVIVVRHAPPPPQPSFERQQQAIRANGGRPLAVSQIRQIQPQNVQVRSNIRVAPKAVVQDVPPSRGRQPVSNADVQPNRGRPVSPNNPGNPNSNPPITTPHERVYTDRPAASRPIAPETGDRQPVRNQGIQPNPSREATPNNTGNPNGNPPVTTPHERVYTERPAASRPVSPTNSDATPHPGNVNPQVEQKHPQEAQNPRNQPHPQRVEQPQRKQDNVQQNSRQQPKTEKKKDEKPSKPPKEEKPHKNIIESRII